LTGTWVADKLNPGGWMFKTRRKVEHHAVT